jgi:hypothetical protein
MHLISCSPLQVLNSSIINTSIVNHDSKNATNILIKHTRLHLLPNSLSFFIRNGRKIYNSLVYIPITINNMASDTHIIKILHRSPRISSKTNLSTSCQEHCPQLFLLRYKDLHTILNHGVTRRDLKPRINCLHEIMKTFTLHKLKRQLIHNYHPSQSSPYFLDILFRNDKITDKSFFLLSFLLSIKT